MFEGKAIMETCRWLSPITVALIDAECYPNRGKGGETLEGQLKHNMQTGANVFN